MLRLAEQEHGRVTVPEVAARCHMTIEEAKTELDRLVLHQVAEIQVTGSGVLVYVFPRLPVRQGQGPRHRLLIAGSPSGTVQAEEAA